MAEQTRPYTLQPFYLEGKAGRLFSIYYKPANIQADAVLFFPPFAEELNKSRRMISLQARSFAQAGLATLVIDLYGTGDSEGELHQASWRQWQEDMALALAWLSDQGHRKVVFWGLRLGCALVMDLAAKYREQISALLLWQPVLNGQVFLNQLLRLKLAAELFSDQNVAKVSTKDLRISLKQGQNVEIAGYELNPSLADSIEQLRPEKLLTAIDTLVIWLEVVPGAQQSLSPVSCKLTTDWQQQGVTVNADTVVGEQFWVTPEISTIPALLDKSTAIVSGAEVTLW